MKSIHLLLLAAVLAAGCGRSENSVKDSLPKDNEEQQDTIQTPEKKAVWARITAGDTHAKPNSYDRWVITSQNGVLAEPRSLSCSAWRNDHVGSRLDFFTYEKSFPGTTLRPGDLVSESGARISKSNIKAGYLDAINTKSENYPDINYMAYDVITRKTVRDVEPGLIYSAWVDIYVPSDTPKGIYRGQVELATADTLLASLDYELEVFDFTLTEPDEWETFLDLWETPFASNRYYSGKTDREFFNFTTPDRQDTNPFSLYYVRLDPKYQAGLESELELYHQAGGNTISVHVVEAPDNSRFPCATPSMIKWKYKADGSWEWDYTDMDYFVELNIKHGIKRQIDLFYHTGVGWGFVAYDEAKGEVNNDHSGQPGKSHGSNDIWKSVSKLFLTDLVAHLEEKGWFDMAVLYMDERLYEVTLDLVEAAEAVTNSKGVTLKAGGAVNGKEVEPLYDRMYDVSIWENARPSNFKELAESRRANGQQTTLYSCGSGKMSTVNEPAESAFAVYEARKYGADGVMRWALNKFDLDPRHGTLHTTCYPGDCYLIYPDEKDSPEMKAQSSPRFEKLCEGMRMSEKLNLIRKNNPGYATSVDEIVASLKSGSNVKEVAAMRDKVRALSAAVQDGKPYQLSQ